LLEVARFNLVARCCVLLPRNLIKTYNVCVSGMSWFNTRCRCWSFRLERGQSTGQKNSSWSWLSLHVCLSARSVCISVLLPHTAFV